jgi:hypothetical protein
MREPCHTSGNQTATAQILTGEGYLMGVDIVAGSDACTLKLYDGTASTDRLLATYALPTGSYSLNMEYASARACQKGIYAVLTGTSAAYNVAYIKV